MQNGTLPPLASDVDLLSVAARCSNLSGADCMNVVKTASVYAIQELDRWRARGWCFLTYLWFLFFSLTYLNCQAII